MTDRIYYKVQYPLKKAINIIKNVDSETPFAGKSREDFTSDELKQIKTFLEEWEKEGRDNLQNLINRLRKIQ